MKRTQSTRAGHGWLHSLWNGVIASGLTYVLASIAHSHYVVSQVRQMGAAVTLSQQWRMSLGDLQGLYAYATVIAFGLAIAWLLMAGVRRQFMLSRWIAYPLGGVLSLAAIMAITAYVFPMTPIAPARDATGIVGQCVAGLLGGVVFAWLQEGAARRSRKS